MSETLAIRVNADNSNHHLWQNGESWWIHYTVHTGDGRKRRVRYSLETTDLRQARLLRDAIFVLWTDIPPTPRIELIEPLVCDEGPQPDPASFQFIATICRGLNIFGTLVDTLYISTESDGERPPSLVLWYQLDSTQAEDNESHIYPVARAPLADFPERKPGSTNYRAGAAALLHAWVRNELDYYEDADVEVEESNLLDTETILHIIDRACRHLSL
jgi:hypothetical protein